MFTRWREHVLLAVGEARAEIDALNVYPVPDRDTGTNVYLTVEAAVQAATAAEAAGASLADVSRAFVDGALRGARGNSGVILAEMARAAAPLLSASAPTADPMASGQLVAQALRAATDAAWAAVGQPVEGTILSVAAAAADAAGEASSAPLPEVLREVATAAQQALGRTTQQLDPLRQAGVVDAGGRALVVVLDTTEHLLAGRPPATVTGTSEQQVAPRDRSPSAGTQPAGGDLGHEGPAYEVMYLLDASDEAVPALRTALGRLGGSVVVVGGDGLWNVHAHVNDVGAAIEAGIAAGHPHQVVVTHLADEVARAAGRAGGGRVVVAGAAGPGLAALFRESGAVVVGGEGGPAGADELLDTLVGQGVAEAVILPNDRALGAAAAAAAEQARDRGIRVAVIPTRAQVQGLAALAVHDPGRSFDDDVAHMSTAAGQTRHGAVTVATGKALTTAGPCEQGDVLGVVDGDVAMVGDDVCAVAVAVVERLLAGSGELLTLVSGTDAPDGLVAHVRRHVLVHRPDVEVLVHEGGQAAYPLLVAVE